MPTTELTAPLRGKHPFVDIKAMLLPVDGNGITIVPGYENGSKETPNLWELLGGTIQLICDATVITRTLFVVKQSLDIIDPTYQGAFATGAVTASQGIDLHITPAEDKTYVVPYTLLSLGAHLRLYPGWVIFGRDVMFFNVANGQAGDTLSYHLRFKHLNRFLGI